MLDNYIHHSILYIDIVPCNYIYMVLAKFEPPSGS